MFADSPTHRSIPRSVWREMTTSKTDVHRSQYVTFLKQKMRRKTSVLQLNVIQRCGGVKSDLQTSLVILKAKELPASRCNQVREKAEQRKEEKGKEHLFCQSKITIHQGTQVYKKGHPEQDEVKVN